MERSKQVALTPGWVLWIAVCILTLGFPAKYRERLRLFEGLAPSEDYEPWSTPAVYSDVGGEDSKKSLRQKQQVIKHACGCWLFLLAKVNQCFDGLGGMGPTKYNSK